MVGQIACPGGLQRRQKLRKARRSNEIQIFGCAKKLYSGGMNDRKKFDELPDAEALNLIGAAIDHATDTQDCAVTDAALQACERLAKRESLTGEQRVLLHYFRANAFENKLQQAGKYQSWSWEIPYLQDVLLERRRALRHEAFQCLDPFRQCQIHTNLGNWLDSVGRPVEAIAQWDRAISLNSQFAMALGNRGRGLGNYGNELYDDGHRGLLLLSAYDSLSSASARNAVFDSPATLSYRKNFSEMAEQIAARLNVNEAREILCREFSLGRSRAERAYRTWCLNNRLFLNPLNDLGAYRIAAHDVLHLPSLTMGIDEGGAEPPVAFGFYNQLKQEFISARWLCYEGLTVQRAHFSDRDTHLYDTLNIPAYSLAVEKAKIAYRLAYSLFDKIAFFINDYFKVGLPEKAVNFRSVWYELKGEPKPLNPMFYDRPNWALRGLFWLSKDIYEKAFRDVSEPDAEGLAELRNHLEHKYCQVHEDLGMGYSRFAKLRNGTSLGYYIGRDTLEAKSLHILKKVRAAMIYLSLAVHREETDRNARRGEGLIAPMPLWMWSERGRL